MGTAEEPRAELSPTARLHVEKAVDGLVEEFGHHQSSETIERLMDDSLRQLVRGAEVEDFVPALAHRFTRERLKALTRTHGRVVAHSAGSQVGAEVDPAVLEAMAEVGADLSEAYAKPLSPEVLAAADMVVTMGRSVGTVQIPEGTRHLDWRVGDPTGASVDEARRVRDEIDSRVTALLAQLEEPAGGEPVGATGFEPGTSSPPD